MGDKARVVLRHIILGLLFFLPKERKKRIERWLRGREEFMRLQRSDWVLMSWGKSGRTWLRVMISRYYQVKNGLPESELLDFDNFHKQNPAIPRVFFTHNNYLRDYTGNRQSKAHFEGKKIVLLVRDPRDVAVSQFFQWKFRMRPIKKFINDYPANPDTSTYDFVMDRQAGVPRIVEYFNGWAEAMEKHGDILIVRYEDMRQSPEQQVARILEFTGTPGSDAEVSDAVEFAAYENMKKMEEKKFFKSSGARVKPGDKSNPQSFKVRRAKVGGYQDYFDDVQCSQMDLLVSRLNPLFGYGPTPPAPADNQAGA